MTKEEFEDEILRHVEEVTLFLGTMVKDENVVNDLVQDTFCKAFRTPRSPHGNIRPWLRRVALNTFIDWYRVQVRRNVVRADSEVVSRVAVSAARDMDDAERAEALRACLDKLNERERWLVRSRLDARPYAELAAITQERELAAITEEKRDALKEALRQQHSRAIKKLKECIESSVRS